MDIEIQKMVKTTIPVKESPYTPHPLPRIGQPEE